MIPHSFPLPTPTKLTPPTFFSTNKSISLLHNREHEQHSKSLSRSLHLNFLWNCLWGYKNTLKCFCGSYHSFFFFNKFSWGKKTFETFKACETFEAWVEDFFFFCCDFFFSFFSFYFFFFFCDFFSFCFFFFFCDFFSFCFSFLWSFE